MTIEEFCKDEEQMNKMFEHLVALQKPYNDKYNELLENKDGKFFEIVDYLFDRAEKHGGRFDLYDYDEPYFPLGWDMPYSELTIDVVYNMLLDMGKAQKSFHADTYVTMFTNFIFVFERNGKAFLVEQFSGQGETHDTIKVSSGRFHTYTKLDLVGLKEYWDRYFESRDEDDI